MIDLCPVGALTSKPFRYTARTWELARRALGKPARQPRQQSGGAGEERPRYARRAAGERCDQRMLAVRQGSLLLRGRQLGGPTDPADAEARRQVGRDRLADGARARRAGAQAHPRALWSACHRRARVAALDARGDVSGAEARPRLRQREHRLSPAPVRLQRRRQARRRDLARACRSRSSPRSTACSSSAASCARTIRCSPSGCARWPRRARSSRSFTPPTTNCCSSSRTRRSSRRPRCRACSREIAVAAAGAAGAAVPSALAGIEPSPDARAIAAMLAGGTLRGVFLGSFAELASAGGAAARAGQHASPNSPAPDWAFSPRRPIRVGGTVAGAYPPQRRAPCRRDACRAAQGVPVAARRSGARHRRSGAHPRRALQRRTRRRAVAVQVRRTRARRTCCCRWRRSPRPPARSSTARAACRHSAAWCRRSARRARRGRFCACWARCSALPGFDYDSIEAVRDDLPRADEVENWLSNATQTALENPGPAVAPNGLERIADVPIYAADPLVRRAPSLQKTRDARAPTARMNAATLSALKLADGAAVSVRQGSGEAMLSAALDPGVPDGCVRIAAAHPATRTLGPMFGPIAVEGV